MAITFTVPGDPVPQPRARITTRGGHGHAYTPASHPVHAYRHAVALCAKAAGVVKVREVAFANGDPVAVVIDAVFARPKSHMNKSGVKPSAPRIPRPDVDNIAKAVLDALQTLMGDDTAVCRLVVEKSYASSGRTTIRLSLLGT